MTEQHFSLLQLRDIIDEKKREMIGIGLSKGLLHEDTLLVSQQLDALIIEYQRLLCSYCKATSNYYWVS